MCTESDEQTTEAEVCTAKRSDPPKARQFSNIEKRLSAADEIYKTKLYEKRSIEKNQK